MEKRIYYFSGTGNSFRAAQRIAQALGDTRLISMRCDPAQVSAEEAEVIGFVFPIYHWSVCVPVQAFIKKLKVNPKAYIFAVTTPVAVNGFAFEKLDEMLRAKGARLHYGRILRSVANLCIVYPPFPSEKRVIPRSERELGEIAAELAARKERKYPKAGFLTRRLYPLVMPKYLPVQPYVDMGFRISEACVSCGICSKVCPQKNIDMQSGKPVFLHNCCSCMACVAWCPKKAVLYELPLELKKQVGGIFVRVMGLPEKRKRYHHPMLSWKELAQDEAYYE